MSRPLPIALVQASACPIDAPIARFAEDVTGVTSAYQQVRLVAYPENHLFGIEGPGANERLSECAEPLDGPRVKALAELAGDLGVWLLPGTVCERGPGGEFFDTAVVFSPAGRLVASYRKMFPWRPYEPYDPGDRFVTFEIDGVGRAGLSICYDSWFPEVTRHLAWMGAEVVFNLVKTTTSDRAQELVLARANAIMNQVFVASINSAGPVGTGQSLVVDPEGLVRVSTTGASETVMTDVLDLDHVSRVREFGTAGLNRMWSQLRPGERPVALPLYAGTLDPARWQPGTDAAR